jgi:hypothetical protein
MHKIGTGGAQHSFDLLDRLPNYTARLAGLNLALQLEEPPDWRYRDAAPGPLPRKEARSGLS